MAARPHARRLEGRPEGHLPPPRLGFAPDGHATEPGPRQPGGDLRLRSQPDVNVARHYRVVLSPTELSSDQYARPGVGNLIPRASRTAVIFATARMAAWRFNGWTTSASW